MKRLSDKQLGAIELALSARDRQILETIRTLRYVKSGQIQRLYFLGSGTPRAKLVMASRVLNRLMEHGLIDHLPNRFKGRGMGSTGLIWYLTEAGARLLDLGLENDKRSRYTEPSSAFIRHTLAVSECFVQITEICRMTSGVKLGRLHIEPECWRSFQKDGKQLSLRPDLYAETVCGRFEDRWFIEMDLDTESTNDIVTKCRRYQYYYQTNKEQQRSGVFPIVLWIVPTEERRAKMIDAIKFNFGKRYPRMHLIITPKELWKVITEGAEKEDLC